MAPTSAPHQMTLVKSTENQNVEIITICAMCSFLSLVAIVARLASRRIKQNALAVDDAFLIAAWVGNVLLPGLSEN